ncbi:DUF3616 domain-containing protein [Devosia sp. LjRoot16]|uniref:DUF3616 domain-containing protein n=1 Tax=Devosia sp. LjRoot16 TaxID=3342271 RepID=UPI003ECC88BB
MPRRVDPPFIAPRELAVIGEFRSGEAAVATDLSGIASAAPLNRRRRKCLVIDNEGLFAQFATLDTDAATLTAGAVVPLLPTDRDALEAVGNAPDDGDPGPDRYILDGEGVAWLGPHYYVTGSHSIHDWITPEGRKRADYRRSAHLVARISRDGRRPELSFRLNELLAQRKSFAPYFLKSPNKRDGLNIEGLAAWRRRLYFGFRSPVIDGKALLLSVRAAALFTPGADLAPRTLRVPLGRGAGIRDLAMLPNGRLLILSGPASDATAGFAIHLFDRKRETVRRLGRLAPIEGDKVEGLLLAGYASAANGSASAELLVLADHPANGRPRLFTLDIPPA